MARINIDDVAKAYRGSPPVVEHVSLDIHDGEFMVLVGPSGSGKSTVLRMVAGLEEITHGTISVGDRVVNDVAPRDRDLAMVFQNYALYPHMTVAQNMAFALRLRHVPKDEQRRRVESAASLLGLEPYLDRKPAALSGGQRQRVAMGRAIVREPKAFLMDEPLSNLDAKLRVSMRGVLASLHERLSVTTVYVTHDQVEAMTLGDRVAVLAEGRLQQVDTPQQLFDAPANLFVAGFIGSPAMNMVTARLIEQDGALHATFGSYRLPLPPHLASEDVRARTGGEVVLGIRPSDFLEPDDPEGVPLAAKVAAVEELGSEVHAIFEIDAPAVVTDATRALTAHDSGEEEALAVAAGHSLWTARLSPDAGMRPGTKGSFRVDVRRAHLFDPVSGVALGHPPIRGAAATAP